MFRMGGGRILAAASLLFASVLVSLASREDCWGDEGFSLRRIDASWRQLYFPFASRPAETYPDPFDRNYVFDHGSPLYFVVVRAVLGKDAGIVPIRLFSIVPAAATLLLVGWWAWGRLGRTAGLATAALFACSPTTIYFGHEIRPYAMGMLLAAAMPVGAWRLRQQPLAAFAWLFFSTAAGILTHEFFLWCAFALTATLVPGAFRQTDRPFSLAAIAGLGSGALAALALRAPQILSNLETHVDSPPFSLQVVLHTIALPVAGADGRHAVLGALLVLLVGLATAALALGSERAALGSTLLALWLGPVLIALAARGAAHVPLFPRYTVFALPGWFMTAAWMADEASRRSRATKTAVFGLLGATLLLSAYNSYQTFRRPLRPAVREAAQALVDKSKAGDYFAVDPDWLGICVAERSQGRPAARYIYLGEGVRQDARTIWIVGFPTLSPLVGSNLAPDRWSLEPDTRTAGMYLWKATRLGEPDKGESGEPARGAPASQ
ncbi:hypothetical protein JW916_07035 [Candidatus Sumerlaeota bacterium]|nr:hypothetical protein [Candidatus Sumerlaeota bacterium]